MKVTQNKPNNDNDLLDWIHEEKLIFYPDDDIFNLGIIGRRIARLFLEESSSNIGIVGPYGSGKSSLINLVVYYLKSREKAFTDMGENPLIFSGEIIFCRIDGWGRIKGSIAQTILALAIEQVKHHVDCMSVITLPENYNKAISDTKVTGGAVLAALLQNTNDPVEQLATLDDILIAADLRLVIFLEDLDRNISDTKIIDEMPALLDRLRVLKQISFVLAIGTEHEYSGILVRICDHIESISVISCDYLIQTIDLFLKPA